MSKKVMRLLDPNTCLMECKVCGSIHCAIMKPKSNGHFYQGSWQCLYGCKETSSTTRSNLANSSTGSEGVGLNPKIQHRLIERIIK